MNIKSKPSALYAMSYIQQSLFVWSGQQKSPLRPTLSSPPADHAPTRAPDAGN